MDHYGATWGDQRLKGTLSRKHPRSMTRYIQALMLRFEEKEPKNEAYVNLEKLRYDRFIRDILTHILMHNGKAIVSGAALKNLIFDGLQHKILEQMCTVDLTGRTDDKMINTIMKAGRTVEKWDWAKKNLGFEKSISDVRRQ